MDRLNHAACSKVASMVSSYADILAKDISENYDLPYDELKLTLDNLTKEYFTNYKEINKNSTCTWFTKRGEPCHKEKRPGYEFCSVHAEYFHMHNDEINRAKSCPLQVNVTRKGLHKTSQLQSIW